MLNDLARGLTDRARPLADTRGRLFGVATMRFGLMLGQRGVGARSVASNMTRHASSAVKDLHHMRCQTRLDARLNERIRYRVVVAGNVQVIVGADFELTGPFSVFEDFCWERTKARRVELLEAATTATVEALERPTIELRQQFADRRVDVFDAEEALVTQLCQYPSLS